ncbi:MAG: hypothetical protein GXY45_10590 [Ramlibacter sp.]|nr:hypothetical protein [Ramlibacter sp.]
MLTPSLMQSMSLQHLLAAAHAEIDPLTSTPLEHELLRRLDDMAKYETLIDSAIDNEAVTVDMLDVLDHFCFADGEDLRKALQLHVVLERNDIRNPDALQALIDASTEVRAMADDLTDTATSIHAIFNRLAFPASTPEPATATEE